MMRGRLLLGLIGTILLMAVYAMIVGVEPRDDPLPTATDRPSVQSTTATRSSGAAVEYVVTASGDQHPVSLTYTNATGGTEQVDTVTAGRKWTYTFQAEPGQFLYLSVQNELDSGGVACWIVVDGQIVEKAESAGAYVIASCSGSVRR